MSAPVTSPRSPFASVVLRSLHDPMFTREPAQQGADHDAWWVEQIIGLAHDADEPHWLGMIGDWLRWDLTPAQIADSVNELLDLQLEIGDARTRTPRWECACDEYRAALTKLATRRSQFDMDVDRALAIQDVDLPGDELAARRGGAR